MKFIHFADAHLDSPFRGLSFLPSKEFNKIHNAANQSLEKIVDLAVEKQVDLVLIAGDTFDSSKASPNSQLFFAKEIKKLTDAKIQVVMIFGNHDHMNEGDLLIEKSPYFKLLGTNENIEKASFETKAGFKYDVVGFSYLNNHIEEDMIKNFPIKSSNFTFGLMHAQEKSSSGKNVYAPYTSQEIKNLNYDYFALGHIHKRQIISEHPLVVYPGNIQGRHINELGEKGCYLGEVDEKNKNVKISFLKTAPITWQEAKIEIKQEVTKNELQNLILETLYPAETTYYSLKVIGAQNLTDEEMELLNDSSFWLSISLQLAYGSQLVDVRFESNDRLQLNSNDDQAFKDAKESIFEEEFLQIASDWAKKDILSSRLVNSPSFKKHVKELAEVKLASRLKGLRDDT